MKRLLQCAVLLLAFVLIDERVLFAADNETKPGTLAEQLQAIQQQFGQVAYAYFHTNDVERPQLTTRAERLTIACLDLVEKNPKDPIALDALVQVVNQEYWLENYSL